VYEYRKILQENRSQAGTVRNFVTTDTVAINDKILIYEQNLCTNYNPLYSESDNENPQAEKS
jgi:hypothetical protein